MDGTGRYKTGYDTLPHAALLNGCLVKVTRESIAYLMDN
jgi:hypothetical protein